MSISWWIETRTVSDDYLLLGPQAPPELWWSDYGQRTDRDFTWFIVEMDAAATWRVYIGMSPSSRQDLVGRSIRNSFAAKGDNFQDLSRLLMQYLHPNGALEENLELICGEDTVQRWVDTIKSSIQDSDGKIFAIPEHEAEVVQGLIFGPSSECSWNRISIDRVGIYSVGAQKNVDYDMDPGRLGLTDGSTLNAVLSVLEKASIDNSPARVGYVSYASDALDASSRTAIKRRPDDGYELWLIRGDERFQEVEQEREVENPNKARVEEATSRAQPMRHTQIKVVFLMLILLILSLLMLETV